MRIVVFILLAAMGIGMSHANNTAYLQSTKLSLTLKNKTIKEVFSEIEKSTEYIFLYQDESVDLTKKVSINISNQTIDKVLDEVFRNTPNTYYVSDRQVFVSKLKNIAVEPNRERMEQSPMQQQINITGTVTDNNGETLIGVTVKLKSQPAGGVTTDLNGKFSLRTGSMDETLVFTYIGMKVKEVKLKAGVTNYKVALESNETELGVVTVQAGIMQRNKLGFTGSYNQLSGEELRSVGSINVIQSLKSLDPSITIADNALMGSDPNTLAHISLRGGTAMNITSTFNDYSVNPNEPLFILDGTESSLAIISDMDINRIESMTILKDAGSTAIYGSKGANGVIVVETVKPKPGQLRIGYSGTMQFSAADLSVYNMMNASEKLEFEVLAGRYGNLNDWINNRTNIESYNSRLENVTRGIDTYWMKVPIRTALTQSHSLNIDGGDNSILYQIGAQYKNLGGVMKGSDHETFGGNVRLQYRKNDKINITNNFTLSVSNSDKGAWGSYSDFVNANPYFRMINEDGTIPKYLDSVSSAISYGSKSFANPYYNAMLDSRYDSRNLVLTNQTTFDWYILPTLRWENRLVLQTSRNDDVSFKDPRHTDFEGKDYMLQGTYASSNSSEWSYSASTALAYAVSIQNTHNLTFNARAAIQSTQYKGDGYSVTGFPKGVPGIPSYSYGYVENSRPLYSEDVDREVNLLAALNYNYKYRYLFDASVSNDGSNTFGLNNRFRSFWSVGVGWNVDKEPFAQNWGWLDNLKIRMGYGINGNQNVSNISSNIYSYFPGNNIFGAGAYLSQFANPDLGWQVAEKTNLGINLTTQNNRLNLTFDIFRTLTDPQTPNVEQKPSTGVSSYPVNLGYKKVEGLDFSASYQIIRDIPRGIMFSARVSGMTTTSVYGGFADALRNLNEKYKEETGVDPKLNQNSLVRYQDGASEYDIWAVRSLGIDPATGQEVYLTKSGTPTFIYSADDRVPVASANPDLTGVVGFTFKMKNLTANLHFRYSFGGYAYNSVLVSKVENINSTSVGYNQDKRALYDRWQNVGDVAAFKSIRLITTDAASTPISSRFIQRDDSFSGESAKISYDFTSQKWVKSLGLNYLTVHLSYSDLFRISTVKMERSLNYPFARSVGMGISAQF